MSTVDKVCDYIDKHQEKWVNILGETVAIKSISAYAKHRQEVVKMAQFLHNHIMKTFEGSFVGLQIPSKHLIPEGQALDLPPIVMARIGVHDPEKKTLLIYGHYDVQPALKSDGWDTEPFEMVNLADGSLRGRGTTDDKGPLIGWLNMLESYQACGIPFPVNVKFVLEGMEESGSIGFDETVKALSGPGSFFDNVDFCCISDNYWLTTKKPCLTHGLRGYLKAWVKISGPKMDLHSGGFGGLVYEPIDDLMHILASFKDMNTGKIAVDGIYDEVPEVSADQMKRMKDIDFSVEAKKKEIGVTKLWGEEDSAHVLRNYWVLPSLTVHGIEGAFAEPGMKTVISREVIGKVSIRTVPNMTEEKTMEVVNDHINKKFAERNSCNRLHLEMQWGHWWFVDPKGKLFEAAAAATKRVHGVDPDYTCEGGSIPPALSLTEITGGKEVCLLPMGRCDDGAHSQNEKLDLSNYMLGMKTFAAFVDELSKL